MKKSLVSLAVAATLAVGGAAHAGVMAVGEVLITNLQINKVGGGILSVGDFQSPVNFANTGDLTAILNGTSVNSPQTTATPAPFDSPMACVGDCGIAQNTFGTLVAPATTNRARADSQLTGAILAGTPFPTGATANLLTEVQMIGESNGTATGNIGLSSTVRFTASATQAINISMNAAWRLITDMTADVPNGFAQSSTKWSLTIRELGTGAQPLFSFAPGELNQILSANDPAASLTVSGNQAFTSGNYTLNQNRQYQLTISHEARSDANMVPEPSVVALLGVGLLGGFAGLRRRRAVAA